MLFRSHLLEILDNSQKPVKGSELASTLEVSRQVIVQDIALLRAEGVNVIATPQGYLLLKQKVHNPKKILPCQHSSLAEMEDVSIKPLALCQVEPRRTLFYNGLITTYIAENERKLNQEIKLLITQSLVAGYKGKLLLWQNLSLAEVKIKVDTKVKEL